MNKNLSLILPWPPSVNKLWRTTVQGHWFMTKAAKAYKKEVWAIISQSKAARIFGSDDELEVNMIAYPPDNRVRDLDNLLKLVFDSLQDAAVFPNDNQIKKIQVEMKKKDPHIKGELHVRLQTINYAPTSQ